MCYTRVLGMYGVHFIGSLKCAIYIHICWYLHVVHFMGVMKCTVEAFKTCSNQGLIPTYLQKVGSISISHCQLSPPPPTTTIMGNNSIQLRERHESLYFTDGNVVLSAPRPDKAGLLFRVHKSVLSSHSLIFKDMFDTCGPSDNTSETNGDNFYDGVPLICMPDDGNDLESVLKILYYQR